MAKVKENKIKTSRLLRCLPAIFQHQMEYNGEYRENPVNTLVYIMEEIFSTLEQKIDVLDIFFDPRQVPGEDFLTWLASWVALDPDEDWSEEKKRNLIKDAARLYCYRGTMQGMKQLIKRFFDIEVEIREWCWPRGMEIGTRSRIGIDSALYDRQNPDCCFELTWEPPSPDHIKPALLKKIRALVDLEKPAHTRCYFNVKLRHSIEPPPVSLSAMIIGISSSISQCCIDQDNAKT